MTHVTHVYHLQHKNIKTLMVALKQLNAVEEAQEDVHEVWLLNCMISIYLCVPACVINNKERDKASPLLARSCDNF